MNGATSGKSCSSFERAHSPPPTFPQPHHTTHHRLIIDQRIAGARSRLDAERALELTETACLESEFQRLSAFDAAKAQEEAREAALVVALKEECDVVRVEQSSMFRKMAGYSMAIKGEMYVQCLGLLLLWR